MTILSWLEVKKMSLDITPVFYLFEEGKLVSEFKGKYLMLVPACVM